MQAILRILPAAQFDRWLAQQEHAQLSGAQP
jgi:hypothetical protein